MKVSTGIITKQETNNKQLGNLFIFLNAFFMSFIGISTKSVKLSSLVVAGITDLCSLIFQIFYFRKYKHILNPLVIITGLISSVTYLTFLLGVQFGTVTNTIVLQYCSPIYVIIFQRLFFHMKINKKQLLAISGCMIGLIWFFSGQLQSEYLWGNVFALISGLLYSATFLLNAHPQNHPPTTGIVSSIGCCLMGIVYILLNGLPVIEGHDIVIMLFVGFILNGCSAILYAKGISLTTPLSANVISLCEVFLAPLWAFMFLGESLPKGSIFGVFLMVVSIIFEIYLEYSSNKTDDTGVRRKKTNRQAQE